MRSRAVIRWQQRRLPATPQCAPVTTLLVIRPAQPEELADIAALKRRVEREAYARLGTEAELEARLDARCSISFLARCLAAGDALFVACAGATLVGLGAVKVDPVQPVTAHLHSLYCTVQQHGLGTALTRARLEWASARGALVVTADCLAGNDAAAAHLTRLGLVEGGVRLPSVDFASVQMRRFRGDIATALRAVAVLSKERQAEAAA